MPADVAPRDLSAEPRRHLAVVTCMDARLDIPTMLDLQLGDAHVLRNAGGIVTDDTLRSLVLSQRALGTRHVVLVHHSRCGVQGLDDDALLAELEGETGSRPSWRFGGFADPAEDVRRSLRLVRDCPWLTSDSVRGYVYDLDTETLIDVEGGDGGGAEEASS